MRPLDCPRAHADRRADAGGSRSIGPKASAQQGKVIRFGVNRAAENLDPVTQDANPTSGRSQIYQQLVKVNVSDGFEPVWREASTSADGRTWTFNLRRTPISNGDRSRPPTPCGPEAGRTPRGRSGLGRSSRPRTTSRSSSPEGALGCSGRHLALLQQHHAGEVFKGREGRGHLEQAVAGSLDARGLEEGRELS